MGFPTTLREFQVTFPDEKACWKTLRKARRPRGFECPRCGHCESSRFEEDLGPLVRGVVDAARTTVRTDGSAGYRGLQVAGVRHDRRSQGSDLALSPTGG